MKKERPILFSTPMVQALLAGRKTQTRRIAKPQPVQNAEFCRYGEIFRDAIFSDGTIAKARWEKGDVLWVRETFVAGQEMDSDEMFVLDEAGDHVDKIWYRADGNLDRWFDGDGMSENIPWKPSIHMPKSAARIWLEITDIRVEKVQDISDFDVFEEGVQLGEFPYDTPISAWSGLWIKINGTESWEANPWVWVVSFIVLSTTGRPDKI